MKEIALSQGKFALVDDEDFEHLNQWRWTYLKGKRNEYAYRYPMVKGKRRCIVMHNYLMGSVVTYDVDHINGNGLDNRRCNLRLCTRSQNIANSRLSKSNRCGYKGVTKQGKKYYARIHLGPKNVCLGGFDYPEAAAKAYDMAAIKHFGEFACVNFKHTNELRLCKTWTNE